VAKASVDPEKLAVPPQLARLELDASLAGAGASWNGEPAVRVAKIRLAGDPAGLRLTVEGADAGPAQVNAAELTVTDPLADNRRLVGAVGWTADLAQIAGFVQRLQIPVTWPAGMDPRKLVGRLSGTAKIAGPARLPFSPADWTAEVSARGEGLVSPVPLPGVELGPTKLNFASVLKDGRVESELGIVPSAVTMAPYLAGSVPVTVRSKSDLDLKTAETSIVIDLSPAKLELAPVGWQKAAGAAARIEVKVKTLDLLATDKTPRAEMALTAGGLPLGAWSAQAEAEFRPRFGGSYGGWRSAVLREARLGNTTLRGRASANDTGALDVVLESPGVDGTQIVQFLDKVIGGFNAAISAPFVEVPPPVITPPANPGLPEIRGRFTADRIEMGQDEALKEFTATFATRGGWPAEGALKWRCGIQDYTVDWTGAASGDNLTIRLTDTGRLFTAVMAPLRQSSVAAIPPGSILAMIRDIPFSIRGGDLKMRGRFDLKTPGEYVTGQATIDGLLLEKNIDFLDKVAGLVKKRVVLRVPFKVLSADKLGYGQLGFNAQQVFLDGPIDIKADKVTWTPWDSRLLVHGKVFGICFEVAGAPAGNAGFYLCDESQVVRTFTTEDQWDFDETPAKKPEKKAEKPKPEKK
jgi:hypothetical protein